MFLGTVFKNSNSVFFGSRNGIEYNDLLEIVEFMKDNNETV